MATRTQQFVEKFRIAVNGLVNAQAYIRQLRAEYTALDLGNVITDEDIAVGGYDSLTKAQFIDGVSATDSVETVFQTNKTNLYRISKGG
jgi:hypothetical protein